MHNASFDAQQIALLARNCAKRRKRRRRGQGGSGIYYYTIGYVYYYT